MMMPQLLMLATPQDGCVSFPARLTSATEARPWQKSGAGLWIGGLAFAPADIASAEASRDPMTDEWVLVIRFTSDGNKKFLEAQRCGLNRIMEITLDRKVLARPILMGPINGGAATIAGGFREAEVREIADRIAGGPPAQPATGKP